MIEYRTENVDPRYEETATNMITSFGWQLINSEEIYNESTEIVGVEARTYGDGLVGGFMKGFTGRDGTINVKKRKTVTNYIVLQFARDTEMPNYRRIVELEREYMNELDIPSPSKPVKRTIVCAVGAIALLIFVISTIVNFNKSDLLINLIGFFGFLIIMLPVTVFGWKSYKKKMRRYNQSLDRMEEISEEVAELLE